MGQWHVSVNVMLGGVGTCPVMLSVLQESTSARWDLPPGLE